jgi:hypothetical protein
MDSNYIWWFVNQKSDTIAEFGKLVDDWTYYLAKD